MTVVIDASVFNKLFLDEEDSNQAKAFVRSVVIEDRAMLAPTLLRLEVCKTALHFGLDFAVPLDLLNAHVDAGLRLIDPADAIWRTAEEISRTGHGKSGSPQLEDSLYHALAIHAEGTFVTADHRHVAKTEAFGHVTMLSEWRLPSP